MSKKNGNSIEPLPDYINLPTQARWVMLVDCFLGSPESMNISQAADKLGVTRQTVSKDLNDPEFNKFKDAVIAKMIKSTLMVHAWKNITKKIVEKGDTNLSKWLIENFYKPPVDDDEDAHDTIDQFASSNGEMSPLAKAVNDTLRKFEDQGLDI